MVEVSRNYCLVSDNECPLKSVKEDRDYLFKSSQIHLGDKWINGYMQEAQKNTLINVFPLTIVFFFCREINVINACFPR